MSSRSYRGKTLAVVVGAAVVALGMTACSKSSTPASGLSEETAMKAYAYTYPLVSVEVTRRQSTNVARPAASGEAPMNQFGNLAFLPDASFTNVVRANVDTLYSSMFYDVSKEPLVISVPDMGDRYHLFPILDMWTNVQASPGTRTLGAGHAYQFAVTGPNWRGTLPDGVHEYKMPTDGGWIIGRIQVNGPEDLPAVVAIQQQLTAAPLSAYGTAYTPPENTDLHQDWPVGQEVAKYIHDLSPQQYWDLYYSSLSHNQPRPEDKDLLDQLAAAGWTPDKKLDLSTLSDSDRKIWQDAWPEALSKIEVDLSGTPANGWNVARTGMGTYGTDYDQRALVAYSGLGANLPEDAIYPATRIDATGANLTSDRNYVLHFAADEIPPVRAFWSLTMYNDKGFFVANPINRYAVRGEQMHKNSDGSLDVYIQRENPGPERESNWLPAPESGEFNLLLRLYWPDSKIIDGAWNPPGVEAA
ncbi:DUF1254 domain-containing protein [Nocardia huaxiensis]|uniref:DUF1254 domain-containing protein n=1 Tax=Nocardia huaxiensis TaxID=2755382 RepID=A0A7D6YZU9_9NOCA|nr:DUF1254 domain-containing protein [Nocardia huaxiensis]QLY28806.1 DUF1254 domain-containing protein [Nocardia huaxiensis]UFS97718.1 DUF1254 domain-containing protein [Nocardia huaxiensis]